MIEAGSVIYVRQCLKSEDAMVELVSLPESLQKSSTKETAEIETGRSC